MRKGGTHEAVGNSRGEGGLIAAVVLVNVPATVLAAPALQLPWPTGEQHRIWGGYTYGCGTHGGPGYETNYYAIDFVFSIGQNVSGTAGGTVIIAAIGYNGGAGNYLAVDHGGGFVSRYLHLRATSPFAPGVGVGTVVSQGQLIGYSGDTGGVAAHLHFDLKLNGGAYKPEPMSRTTGFGWYGFSVESGLGCASNAHDPSPYWTSWPPLSLIEGTLFKTLSDATVYVADQGKKRPISGSAFEPCGYHWNEIVTVPDTTVNMMVTGSTVSTGTPGPYTLVKSFTNGTVYVLWQFYKQVIASTDAFNACMYNWGYIVSWSDSALSPFITLTYPTIPPCLYTRYP